MLADRTVAVPFWRAQLSLKDSPVPIGEARPDAFCGVDVASISHFEVANPKPLLAPLRLPFVTPRELDSLPTVGQPSSTARKSVVPCNHGFMPPRLDLRCGAPSLVRRPGVRPRARAINQCILRD